jgi:ribosomal protein S12 methylthiotransferase
MSSDSPKTSPSRQKVGFVSLGCPKALVDSERILTELRIDGYQIVPSYDDADLVIVNTCGFIDSAKAESLEAIGEALNENGRVLVTGCMGADAAEILKVHPKVLGVTGPQQYEQVVSAVHQYAPLTRKHDPLLDLVPPQGIKLTPRHYAYLKISEGCNHRCRFCIIPAMRGDLVSRPIEQVLAEAGRLVRAGVRELLVIAQDTSAYGVDLKYQKGCWRQTEYETRLYDLCVGLGSLGVWVRLHYIYPYPHVDRIIPLMAEGRILPYLDIPLQHGSPRILKLMKRPAATVNTLQRIRNWREICPDLTIRSTFIVGFPGETEDDFEQLLDFLEAAQLDRVGCFQYSPVQGAKANDLPGHVADEVKQDRWDRLMQFQASISTDKLAKRVGRELEVMVDSIEDGQVVTRSWADAPEIDGKVYLEDSQPGSVSLGEIIRVKIQRSDAYDLWARQIS